MSFTEADLRARGIATKQVNVGRASSFSASSIHRASVTADPTGGTYCTVHTSAPSQTPFNRRESTTRLFLKADAVFKAWEEQEQHSEAQHQDLRPTLRHLKRYTTVDATAEEQDEGDASHKVSF